MRVTIKEIRLKNWFNFRGEFESNIIPFKNGVNIIAADNNGGKTKLFNALKWLIDDRVILMHQNNATTTQITNRNVSDVFNISESNLLSNGGNNHLGIILSFETENNREEIKTYRVTKKLKIRKNVDKLEIYDEFKNIRKLNRVTQSYGPSDLNFEEAIKRIIPASFRKFLFIEGEQISEMTDLEGKGLKDTIYSIVNLETLDNIYEKLLKIKSESKKLLDKAAQNDVNLDQEIKDKYQEKSDLQNKIEAWEYDIETLLDKRREQKQIREKFTQLKETSQRNKDLAHQYNQLSNKVKIVETKIDTLKSEFIKKYVSAQIFAIANIYNINAPLTSLLEDKLSDFKTMIATRRTELDDNLSEEEQKMILSLEKSQPKPEILKRMLNKNKCFVCSSQLSPQSRDYMNDKLIPFFENNDNEDPLLNKIEGAHFLFQDLIVSTSNYNSTDLTSLNEDNKKIATYTQNKINAQEALNTFVNENGNPTDNNQDEINIVTYDEAIRKIISIEKELEIIGYKENGEYGGLIGNALQDIKVINSFLKINKQKGKSETVVNAEDYDDFAKELSNVMEKMKRDRYQDFVDGLGKLSTKRYQRLLAQNISRNNTVQVQLLERGKNNYEFKIDVVDTNGNPTKNAGGADQALRRISVVLALLDMKEDGLNSGYPFILDAPVSRLSSDNKFQFFKTVIEDSNDEAKNIKQVIITSMDIVSSTKSTDELKLNEIGKDLKELLDQDANHQLIGIWKNNLQNTFTND